MPDELPNLLLLHRGHQAVVPRDARPGSHIQLMNLSSGLARPMLCFDAPIRLFQDHGGRGFAEFRADIWMAAVPHARTQLESQDTRASFVYGSVIK
jgi:hypothetical protein